MTVLLNNREVEACADIAECLSALEQAYRQLAEQRVLAGHRADIFADTGSSGDAYNIKVMTTAYAPEAVSVVRMTSDVLQWRSTAAGRRREKLAAAPGGRWTGLILLFCTHTGEPLMICPDGVMQRIRVGLTSALAAQRMARQTSERVALLGSGWQARGHAAAMATALKPRSFLCYSPTASRCAELARNLSGLAEHVQVCESAQAAVDAADIVVCATNSMDPVVETDWFRPGQHVNTIREGELPATLVQQATTTAVHVRENLSLDRVQAPPGVEVPDRETVAAANPELNSSLTAPDLAELIATGKGARNTDADLSVFLNYHGIALQFGAIGAVVWRRAGAKGLGRKLPSEWFTQDVHS